MFASAFSWEKAEVFFIPRMQQKAQAQEHPDCSASVGFANGSRSLSGDV